MLAQYDILPKTNLRVGVETALRRESKMIRYSFKIMVLEISYSLVSDSHAVRANLLIVTNNNHFPRDVEQEKTFDAQLASLIDDNDVVSVWCEIDHLSHKIPWHDPNRDRFAALFQA